MNQKRIKSEIEKIKTRNARVESDKAWETSVLRIVFIVFLTYLTCLSLFLFLDFQRPFESALIPSMGFLLSTLSLPILKRYWLKKIYNQ